MSQSNFEQNPQLHYPLTREEASALNARTSFAVDSIKAPKSAIYQCTCHELETAQKLWEDCLSLAAAHGIAVEGNDIRAQVSAVTPEQFQKQYLHANSSFGMLSPEQSEASKLLADSPLWNEYVNHFHANPMCAYGHVSTILRETQALCKQMEIQHAQTAKGEKGEELVEEYLQLFRGKYLIKSNVLLNSRTSAHAETSESDFCVITPKGIFVCEVKNIGNYNTTIHIAKDGRWEIIHRDSGRREVKSVSPTAQNAIHCREMECFLEEKGLSDVNVIPVIIIANNATEIQNESMNYVIRKEELYNILRCDPAPVCLTREQMQTVSDWMDQEQVAERWFDVKIISGSVEQIKAALKQALDAYSREMAWNQESCRFFEQEHIPALVAQKKARQAAAAQEADRRSKENSKRRFRAAVGIFVVLGFIFAAMRLHTVMEEKAREEERLAQYTNDGRYIFVNAFGDTLVLTSWPLDKFEGKWATEPWFEISDYGSLLRRDEVNRVVILDDIYPTSTANWFAEHPTYRQTAPVVIENFENLHMDYVRNASYMFGLWSGDQLPDMSGWDMSSVEDISYMFYGCDQLQSIDLSGWDMPALKTVLCTFDSCERLEYVNLSGWNTPSLTDTGYMFTDCSRLQNVDLTGWDISASVNTEAMFSGCDKLETYPEWYTP